MTTRNISIHGFVIDMGLNGSVLEGYAVGLKKKQTKSGIIRVARVLVSFSHNLKDPLKRHIHDMRLKNRLSPTQFPHLYTIHISTFSHH